MHHVVVRRVRAMSRSIGARRCTARSSSPLVLFLGTTAQSGQAGVLSGGARSLSIPTGIGTGLSTSRKCSGSRGREEEAGVNESARTDGRRRFVVVLKEEQKKNRHDYGKTTRRRQEVLRGMDETPARTRCSCRLTTTSKRHRRRTSQPLVPFQHSSPAR